MISKVQNQKSAIIYCITIISKNIFINERNTSDYELWIIFGRSGEAVGLSAISFSADAPKGCRSNP